MSKQRFTDELVQEVAILLAEHRKPQADIAELLGVSAATVNRAASVAVERNWLRRTVELGAVDPKSHVAVRRRLRIEPMEESLKRLEERGGTSHLQELHVFEGGEPPQIYRNRLKLFSKPAAALLAKRLIARKPRTVGISWGVTLEALCEALQEAIPSCPFAKAPALCIPIAGSPPDVELHSSTSAPRLADELGQTLNGQQDQSCSFSAGAWIPAEFSDPEAEVIRRFCLTSPSYARVFGDEKLVRKLECIIISVGAINEFASPWLEAAARAAGVPPAELSRLTVGNISGNFLPIPGLDARGRKTIERLNARWLGVQCEHLHECAKIAAAQHTLGVVLIAVGARKAEIILESVKAGLVNLVICDRRLLDEIEKLLPPRRS